MTTMTTASDKGVSGGHSQGATVASAGYNIIIMLLEFQV